MKNTTPRVGNPNELLTPKDTHRRQSPWWAMDLLSFHRAVIWSSQHWEIFKGSKFSFQRQSAILPSNHALPAQARPWDFDFLAVLKLFPWFLLLRCLLLVPEV